MKTEGFFCILEILYGGPEIGKLLFDLNKIDMGLVLSGFQGGLSITRGILGGGGEGP